MIYESLVVLFFILIVIRSIMSENRHQKLIELSAQRLANQRQQKQKRPAQKQQMKQPKQPKQMQYEFIEDDTDPYLIASNEEEETEAIWM